MVNLDAMDLAELGEAVIVFASLTEYAHKKRLAVAYRKDGNITEAVLYERLCEMIYERLPAWGRW